MRLKTTTKDACKEQLLRGGFKPTTNSRALEMRLQNKPGEVYDAWFPCDGFRGDWFVRIHKGAVAASKSFDGFVAWDISNTIILKLV